MGYLSATLDSLRMTFRQALRAPTTVNTPFEIRERAPRIRASFALVHEADGDEACIGCRKCEEVCPSEIITVVSSKKPSPISGKSRGYADDFTLNLQACIVCELCVQVCPTDAIVMTQEQERPGFTREDLTLTMDKLYANEKNKRWAWGNATILAEQQDPNRGLEKPAKPVKAAKPGAEATPEAGAGPAATSGDGE